MNDGLQGDRQGKAPGPVAGAFLIALALGIAGAVIVHGALTAPAGGGYARIGPQAVPWVIGICMLALSAGTAIAAWRGDFPSREKQDIGPMAWIAGGLVLQMLLLKPAGFSIATGLLFAATARGFGRGPLWLTVPAGVLFALLVWIVFAKGLSLNLPAGPLESLF